MTNFNFNLKDESEKTTFTKPLYLKFTYGNHIVRMLSEPEVVFTHYLSTSKVVFTCLGDECPICNNNRKLVAENSNIPYNQIKGIIPRSRRHLFNGLDRTEVKICPECQEEVKKGLNNEFPPVCSEGHMVVGVSDTAPSNKVKVVNISETNASQLQSFAVSILDGSGEPKGLGTYDIVFMVTKAGDRKNIAPIPASDRNDEVNVPEDSLYDVKASIINLEADEIRSLLKGVSLRDIFLARRVESDPAITELEKKSVEVSKDIQTKIDELF